MKHLWILLSFLSLEMMAQQAELLNTNTVKTQARFNLAQAKLESASDPSGLSLVFDSHELIINYELPPLGEDGQYYSVLPAIRLNGEDLFLHIHQDFRGDFGSPLQSGTKQMRWIHLLSRYVQLEGVLEVNLVVEKWGKPILPYDCSLGEPKFTIKQRRPYHIAAGVGLVSLGLGQLYHRQSEDIYDNDYANASTLAEAEPFYDDANKKHKTYLVLTYSGAAILLADAALFLIRRTKYKEQKKLYERFCANNSISLRPEVSPIPSNASLGLTLSWNFTKPFKSKP